ncbi:MAG: DNA/RNA nuclease SfsA, partial [Pseudomonadota bacterium]
FARPLVPGTLIRRYKRFLADVELPGGEIVTAHAANPGAMLGLNMPGLRVWLEPNDDPKRKLKYTWRLVELPAGGIAGIDTGVPNKLAAEALHRQQIPELAAYQSIRAEQKYGKNSRIDFLLTADGLPDAYLEIKNCHLMREPGLAEFPDCVTERGTKHLGELSAMVGLGHRALMLYVVQRDDCDRFDLARDLDPAYGAAYERARAAGVEVLVWRCTLSTQRIALDRALPLAMDG